MRQRQPSSRACKQTPYEVIGNEEDKTLTLKCFEIGENKKLIFSGTPQEFIEKYAEVKA